MGNKISLNKLMQESDKNALKKPQKRNIARNFKNMTTVLDSNHFNTITYTKYYCVPSFVSKKNQLFTTLFEKV